MSWSASRRRLGRRPHQGGLGAALRRRAGRARRSHCSGRGDAARHGPSHRVRRPSVRVRPRRRVLHMGGKRRDPEWTAGSFRRARFGRSAPTASIGRGPSPGGRSEKDTPAPPVNRQPTPHPADIPTARARVKWGEMETRGVFCVAPPVSLTDTSVRSDSLPPVCAEI